MSKQNGMIRLSSVIAMTDKTLQAVLKSLCETGFPGAPNIDEAVVPFREYLLKNPEALDELGLQEPAPESVRPLVWRVMKEMIDSHDEQQRQSKDEKPTLCFYCDDTQPHWAYERHFRWPR